MQIYGENISKKISEIGEEQNKLLEEIKSLVVEN
jgi:hypothetical protein